MKSPERTDWLFSYEILFINSKFTKPTLLEQTQSHPTTNGTTTWNKHNRQQTCTSYKITGKPYKNTDKVQQTQKHATTNTDKPFIKHSHIYITTRN